MKKMFLFLIMFVGLMCTLSFVELRIRVKASYDVLEVGPFSDYTTIQQAINHANVGDTILVHNGTYVENIIVNKTVSIIGEDKKFTIIDGAGVSGDLVFVKAKNATFAGFTVKGSRASAINLDAHTTGNNISNNIMEDNFIGINLFYSGDNIVTDNMISSSMLSGVYLLYSSGNVFSNNTIFENAMGIYLGFSSSNNVVSGNTFSRNNYGLSFVANSIYNVIYHNNFYDPIQVPSNLRNTWTVGGEGNYWSTFYKGTDRYSGSYQNETGSDGIGDVPRIMNLNNIDYGPLLGVFSDFVVIWKKEPFHVVTICNSTILSFRFEIGEETGNKIIRFDTANTNVTVTFCRIGIPNKLMTNPLIVIASEEETTPNLLKISNETYSYLYFTFTSTNHIQSVAIISSKMMTIYNELLTKYNNLQTEFQNLNVTYNDLLNNYTSLLSNYTELQERFNDMNNSYQQHLSDYDANISNLRNLMYVFAASAAVFIMTTVYLSKRAHVRMAITNKQVENRK